MSFDYFNTSHLAFGAKISKAFLQLNRLLQEGEDNLQDLFQIYEFYAQYIDRNYPAPFPTRPDAPVRAKELYDLLNDGNTLRSIYLDNEGVLHVTVNLFKRISNRFTIASGSTELKEGFAFCRDSVSNKNYSRDIQFVEEYDDGIGNFLFEFRIDSDNNINIVGDSYNYYIPSNFDHITTMEKGDVIFTNQNLSMEGYTAEDYEAILLVGYGYPWDGGVNPGNNDQKSDLHIRVNDKTVVNVTGWLCRQYGIVYLKPGDVLNADCKTAFRIKYKSGEPVPPAPTPSPEPPEPGIEVESYKRSSGNYYYTAYEWRFRGWTEDSTEYEYTGSNISRYAESSEGIAVGACLQLSDTVSGATTISFHVTGNPHSPSDITRVEDSIGIYFMDTSNNVISSQTVTPTIIESSAQPSYADVSEMTIPLGTAKIRIGNLGFQYSAFNTRYFSKCEISNIVIGVE